MISVYAMHTEVPHSGFETAFHRGRELQQQGRYADAAACYRDALAARPDHAGAHNNLAVALMALGLLDEAIASFKQAVACQPDYPEAHNNMGVAYKRLGLVNEALASYSEALKCKPDYAQALLNVGTIFYEHKQYDEALIWYEASLEVDPLQVEAHQNAALILEKLGRHDGVKAHRDAAYGRQALFIDTAPEPRRTVLVLWGAGQGNVPIEHLLPQKTVTRLVCIIEYARADELARLPDYPVVFNAIGDPDVMDPAAQAMTRFLKQCGRPVLNAPSAVARTARHLIPGLLGDLPDVVVPNTSRVATAKLKTALQAMPEAWFPILLRPTNSHGGDHLVKLDSRRDIGGLTPWDTEHYYLTDYVDYASSDGRFRKYRIIFVDRKPYAYHMAVSGHWVVHHDTAGMQHEEWKRQEEAAFLDDPCKALGEKAMAAIEAIGLALDLDYCGVDFSLLPDGRVLVFEANATMLAHPEEAGGMYDYKNPHVQRILDAFDALLERRSLSTVQSRPYAGVV